MSFASETRMRTRPVLPLAAMVDIMFLLLIFFITTSTLRQQASQIDVTLPTAKTGNTGSTDATRVIISITKNGTIYLGTHTVTLAKLGDTLRALAGESQNESVVIRADRQSPWGLGLHVMDLARDAGLQVAHVGVIAPPNGSSP